VAVAVSFLASTATPPAFAGFIFNYGTLTASASASDYTGTNSFTATPVSIPNAAGATISAIVSGPGVPMTTTGSASTTFSMLEWTGQQPRFSPAIHITGTTRGEKLDGTFTSPTSGGGAGGTVVFTETATEGFNQSSLFAGNWTSASVTIKNALSQTIASFFAQTSQTDLQSVRLTPGTYTLEWSLGSRLRVGTLGTSGMEFVLFPEPTSFSLLMLPAIALVSRRVRQ
jgi:hypothetical protein